MFQTASEHVDAIATALVAANKSLACPPRNRTVRVKGSSRAGRDFNYEFAYTTFDALIEHVRRPLTENDLWFVQYMVPAPTPIGERFALATRLFHKSGQWFAGVSPLLDNDGSNQQFGSSLTYMRRYALCAILGLAAEEDDDGNAADGNESKPATATATVSVRAANDNVASAVPPQVWEKPRLVSTDKGAMVFCTTLVGHVRAAKTMTEVDEWMNINLETTRGLDDMLHGRLMASVSAVSAQLRTKPIDQPEKTDAPDTTRPAKSAADDLEQYRKAMLMAKTEPELDAIWGSFKFGKDKRDQAVAIYDARRKTLKAA